MDGKKKIEYVEKVKNWLPLVDAQNNEFVKFAVEFFAFNALLRLRYSHDRVSRERDLIEKLKKDKECYKWFISSEDIKDSLKQVILELNNEPLKNLTRNKTEIKINNEGDWKNIVEALYITRNNLFHGHKSPYGDRDLRLVTYGQPLLRKINQYLIGNYI